MLHFQSFAHYLRVNQGRDHIDIKEYIFAGTLDIFLLSICMRSRYSRYCTKLLRPYFAQANTVTVQAKVNMSINKILESVQLTMKPEI